MAQVKFSPFSCIYENRPPGIEVCGVPGSGKTFFLTNLAANAIEQDGRIFALDGKNDLLVLKDLYPDKTEIVDVNNVSPGCLDPFIVFEDEIDVATVLTVVEIMCGHIDDAQKRVIVPIIQDFVNDFRLYKDKKNTNFRKFAEYLYAHSNVDAQSIGNTLMMNEESKYGPLVFGDPTKVSKKIKFSKQNVVVSILGMTLPRSDKHVKSDELLNAAVVYILCKLIKDILKKREDKQPVLFMLDECHILLKSDAIADVIDEFLVLGRSLNVAICMASQNVTHFPKDMAQQISTKIAFRMSKNEAREFLELFDSTSGRTELDRRDVEDLIPNLKTGYCFVIDMRNRVGFIHITTNFGSDVTSNPLLR